MDYCFTRPPLETASSTAWAPILTCLTYNTLNIRSTASHIKLIRFAPLLRPLMLLGMEPTPAMYLASLALKGGLSAFDKCLSLRLLLGQRHPFGGPARGTGAVHPVIIGATPEGKKELVGFIDGMRESSQSWRDLLLDLKRRGLTTAPQIPHGSLILPTFFLHGN